MCRICAAERALELTPSVAFECLRHAAQSLEESKWESLKDTAGIPALEAEIDAIVYRLYGLDEDEIKVVEGMV